MEELKKYLPANWQETCKSSGALVRARSIKTPEELLALNMLYISNDGSFQIASSTFRVMKKIPINKNATYKRIKASAEWLRTLASDTCNMQNAIIPKPAFLGNKSVNLVDASSETSKDNKTEWRLHYAFDLFNFSCKHMEITKNTEGERLTRFKIQPDEILIGDKAYGTISGIEHVRASGGDCVLRIRSKSFNIYNKEGKQINLLDKLRTLCSLENTRINCYYKVEGELKPLTIVAMRKDDKAIQESLRRRNSELTTKQRESTSEYTKELNEYIVLATTLDYTNEQILELYRARWQIECVFKRLKSLFGYGNPPSKNEETLKAWFYGKLFLAALCEHILKVESFSPEVGKYIVEIVTAKLVA